MSLRDKIQLNQNEIDDYLVNQNDIHIGTINKDGSPHLTTMWYSMRGPDIIFHTYTKSQKIKNLSRDSRISILTESGKTYETLKGVMLYGNATIINGHNNEDEVLMIIKEVEEKYAKGSASEEYIEFMKKQSSKRSGVLVSVSKYISWDHSKI
tara:strand:- start:79 stop:537 length:459 start_codon:yes stop_codon:yes gene_type:complete